MLRKIASFLNSMLASNFVQRLLPSVKQKIESLHNKKSLLSLLASV